MLDTSKELDPSEICRDEDCGRLDIHPKHPVLHRKCEARPHHRPSRRAPWTQDDPDALGDAVERATSWAYPTHFAAIARDVRDDYGPCCDRTIYRHLSARVASGKIVKLDLGLAFAAYIKPGSRLLRDPASIREYMVGLVDQHPVGKNSNKARNRTYSTAEKRAMLQKQANLVASFEDK